MVVPTRNAARTIGWCLEAVSHQEFPPIEVIVVDSLSDDGTADIACRTARVISQDCGIAAARLIGAQAAQGRWVLNLDADQALSPSALRQAVASGHDVVAFGESSAGGGILGFLNDVDRRRLHRHWDQQLDPVEGTIRPRLYPRSQLIRALEAIGPDLLQMKPGPYSEDSLIYANSGVDPSAVGFVPDAIVHREMDSLRGYLHKWRTYGQTARPYRGTPLEKFTHRRARRRGNLVDAVAGLPVLALRAVPFVIGYYL
ncbi:MAG: glycosyltransferase family 2 protein [Thermoplasmata archaeon]|nr:glycosyltransferase family 2 protein [Thermoplasmata archaeon]